MTISAVTETDFADWLQLTLELWPDYSSDEMQSITEAIDQSPKEVGFIVRDDDRAAVGFMNLSLRSDYVPGADHKPVAYVEGMYVRSEYQNQGIGRRMMEWAADWAREQGCHELASDVPIDNAASAEFHSRVGFEEVERTIFFIKKV